MTTQITPTASPATLTDQQYDVLIRLLPTLYSRWEASLIMLQNVSTYQRNGWDKWFEIITPDSLKIMTEKCVPFLVSLRLSTMSAVVNVLLHQFAISAITGNLYKIVKDRYRVHNIIDTNLTFDAIMTHMADVKLPEIVSLHKLRKLQRKINIILRCEWRNNLHDITMFASMIGDYAEVEMAWRCTFSVNSVTKLLNISFVKKETFRMFTIGVMKKLERMLQYNARIANICIDNLASLEVSQQKQCNLIERVCWIDNHVTEQSILPIQSASNDVSNNVTTDSKSVEQDLSWVEKLVS